jgi:hypothetical protein
VAREKQTQVTGERFAQKPKDIASYVKAVRVDILGLAEISVTARLWPHFSFIQVLKEPSPRLAEQFKH